MSSYTENVVGHMIQVQPSLWARIVKAAKKDRVSISAWMRAAAEARLNG